jgi:hypothetical protein
MDTMKMVKLNDDTHARLVTIGKYGETMDDIVKKCIDAYEKLDAVGGKTTKK